MIFRATVFAAFIAVADAQCSVCGDGTKVTNGDAIFVFPGQPAASCTVLQEAGQSGLIPIAQCGFLPPIISICECAPGEAPVEAPTNATPVASVAPVAPPKRCSSCSSNRCSSCFSNRCPSCSICPIWSYEWCKELKKRSTDEQENDTCQVLVFGKEKYY